MSKFSEQTKEALLQLLDEAKKGKVDNNFMERLEITKQMTQVVKSDTDELKVKAQLVQVMATAENPQSANKTMILTGIIDQSAIESSNPINPLH